MSQETIHDHIDRRYAAFSNHEIESLATFFVEDVIWHHPEGEFNGLSAVKQFHTNLFTQWPDMQITLDDLLVAGDKVAARWHVRGTHTVSINGETPTGKTVQVSGITIDRMEGDKAAESWIEYDRLVALQEAGIIPVD